MPFDIPTRSLGRAEGAAVLAAVFLARHRAAPAPATLEQAA